MSLTSKINEFDSFFLTLPIQRNGGLCFEKEEKEIGYNHRPDCQNKTFGDDDNFKSNAYFTVKMESKKFNKSIFENKAIITIKIWENLKKNGLTKPDFNNFIHYHSAIYKHLKKIPERSNSEVIEDRVMKSTIVIELLEYSNCIPEFINNLELC